MKWITWLIIAFAAWWVITAPESAATFAHHPGSLAARAAASAATMISSI